MMEQVAQTIETPAGEAATMDVSVANPENSGAKADFEFEPLFEKPPTEAERRGEFAETKETSKEEDKGAGDKKAEDAAPKADAKEPDADAKEKPEEAAKTEPEAPAKPPKGFVPLAALQEQREKTKSMAETLETIKAELAEIKAAKAAPASAEKPEPKTALPDFKKLSEEEFEALWEDDPKEAIKYQRKEAAYLAQVAEQKALEVEKRAAESKEAEQAARAAAKRNEIVQAAYDRVYNKIPDMAKEDSGLAEKLRDFGVSAGLSEDTMAALTQPETMIWVPGEENPRPLGVLAAEFTEFLHSQFTSKDAKALEAEITARVTKELTDKFKSPSTKGEHRSLGDAHGSQEFPGSDKIPTSESGWRALPAAEREKILRGLDA